MTTANGPTTFADDGRAVIERTIETTSIKHENIERLYEIDRTVTRILEGGYSKIALQFPDELLADSATVATLLREKTGKNIYILADTSYGSCCVDEVAAEHVDADLIVHYGRSCLSPTSRLPVLYVFGQQDMDVSHCIQEFEALFPDKSTPVIIMCDVEYSYAVETLTNRLSETYSHIIPTKIQIESGLQSTLNDSVACKQAPQAAAAAGGGTDERRRGGRHYELPEDTSLESCSIFFIGTESLTLTNIIMVHNKCPIFTYDPRSKIARKETLQVNRMLMKRYSLVQKAKDADTIGIVVGTLGVASYLDIINHLKKLINSSGRKSYTFVMGKLNVAKMANFMEVDCYVLVACPENSLIDSKEFYRPIVTPFELELALVRSKEWTGDYITDFSKLLPASRTDGFTYDEGVHEDGSSDEEPHFSLVTGQYKSKPFKRAGVKEVGAGEVLTSKLTDLTIKDQNMSISRLLNSTAGMHLQNRSFRGLEQRLGEDEAGTVQEGRSGIARGYQDEKNL